MDVEGGVPEAAVAALAADGHRLRRWGEMNLFFGGVSAAGAGRGRPGGRPATPAAGAPRPPSRARGR